MWLAFVRGGRAIVAASKVLSFLWFSFGSSSIVTSSTCLCIGLRVTRLFKSVCMCDSSIQVSYFSLCQHRQISVSPRGSMNIPSVKWTVCIAHVWFSCHCATQVNCPCAWFFPWFVENLLSKLLKLECLFCCLSATQVILPAVQNQWVAFVQRKWYCL